MWNKLYDDYEVSNKGYIRNIKTSKIIKPKLKNGYLMQFYLISKVQNPIKGFKSQLFWGQTLGGHSSAPTVYATKITTDFAMGGRPIYESRGISLAYTGGQKL